MNNEPITWRDKYDKKHPQENDTFATCIIDGYGWRVAASGDNYCIGKIEKGEDKQ